MSLSPILECSSVVKRFRATSPTSSGSWLTALDGVSIALGTGETHGIAGESGCGKSTLGKIIAGLLPPDSGHVSYRGTALAGLAQQQLHRFRRTTQMIFQDPFSSLNPRMRVGDIIAEPLTVAGVAADERHSTLLRMLDSVGMPQDCINRFPDEFSGGQRQRIGIARALISSPEILIADEPVSSLDISIQAQIINLLMQLKNDMHLSMLVVSHNLMVLRHICDTVSVMYLGIVVESAPAPELFKRCRHPYTEALLASIPDISHGTPSTPILTDDLPSPLAIPPGCRFHPRCHHAQDICRHEVPPLRLVAHDHHAACHFSEALYPVQSA